MINRHSGTFCLLAAAALCIPATAEAQVEIRFERIGQNPQAFSGPTVLTQPPGEHRRLYVAEQGGRIKMIKDGAVETTPIFTQSGLVSGGESGLLGMAFHPQFQANGYIYLLFTTNVSPSGTRIMRYTMDPGHPETIDPATAHRIMTIPRSPGTNHQGGWIGFGPDGYLYISSGDAGGGLLQAQEVSSLLGKILRIDVNNDDFPNDPEANYAIPATNPLVGKPGAREEVWASGLRNPWRCSFDRATGDFWIGDVGGIIREEVNFQPAAVNPPFEAVNYGWPCWEGTHHHPNRCSTAVPPFTDPIYEYGRTLGNSVIGGYVYRGVAIPALRGTYIGGDLSGRVFRFRYDPAAGLSEVIHDPAPRLSFIYALGEDQAGEVYVLTGNAGIFRMMPACWANCAGETSEPLLTVNDFTCFINEFTRAQSLPHEQQITHYANCDGSTTAPVLTVDDFTCFIDEFAAGCQ